MERRTFLASAGIALLRARFARAQTAQPPARPTIPTRKVKTTVLFKSPEGYPNAISATQDGLWIAEQKSDNAHLVDWNGKPLKTVKTESKNTSGVWAGAGLLEPFRSSVARRGTTPRCRRGAPPSARPRRRTRASRTATCTGSTCFDTNRAVALWADVKCRSEGVRECRVRDMEGG